MTRFKRIKAPLTSTLNFLGIRRLNQWLAYHDSRHFKLAHLTSYFAKYDKDSDRSSNKNTELSFFITKSIG